MLFIFSIVCPVFVVVFFLVALSVGHQSGVGKGDGRYTSTDNWTVSLFSALFGALVRLIVLLRYMSKKVRRLRFVSIDE